MKNQYSNQRLFLSISRIGSIVGVCVLLFLGSSVANSETDEESYFVNPPGVLPQIVNPPVFLPQSSNPAVDEFLLQFEEVYSGKDVEAFLALFTDDFQNIDVNRRATIDGIDEWREQTERFMAFHQCARRRHLGWTVSGDTIVVQVEWWGIIRGIAFGPEEADRSYHYRGITFLKMDGDKISLQLIYGDADTLNQQLSVPTTETAC